MINLTKYYLEPHRYYHNLNHIVSMFNFANENQIELTNEQILAIWFHDVIYDPTRSDNEEQSAKYFQQWCLTQKVCNFEPKIIKQIILDTKQEIPTTEESALVIDLDLHQLGISKFFSNTVLIRKEFSHLSDKEFDEGRNTWIYSMLNRETIFVSGLNIFKELEQEARTNLLIDYYGGVINNK